MPRLPASLPWDRLFEFMRYAAVGATSALLYLAVYSVGVLNGVPYGVAAVVGTALSIAFSFVMHHRVTFRTGHGGAFTGDAGIWRWITLQVSVMLLNIAGLTVLVHGDGLSRIAAQLVLLPFIPLLSYVLARRFIFKPPPRDSLRVPTA